MPYFSLVISKTMNGVKRCKTKKEVLEYLGKNPNDNKLVDRLIMRGRVRRSDWGYEIVEDDVNTLREEYNKLSSDHAGLVFENARLEKEVAYLKEQLEANKVNTLSAGTNWDYEELKANYDDLHQKFQRLKRGYQLVIDLTYQYAAKNMKISKSDYKEQLAEEVNNQLTEEYWRED